MRLTERDIQILLKVNECYWLSTTQLKRYFFPSTTLYAINKRLKILTDQGYLGCQRLSRTEEYYFRLGNEGKNILLEMTDLDSKNIVIPRRFPVQLKHFSTLNDLRWHCEKAINQKKGKFNFFFIDRELKGLLHDSIIIPDVLFSFSLFQDGIDQRYIIALEYDAATENPQYFGRDKVKKYCQAFDNSHPIISHNNFQVITFADTRKRIVQLIRHSVKFINERMKFLFASIEDLKEYGDFLADIYIDPQRCNLNDEKIMCSIIY